MYCLSSHTHVKKHTQDNEEQNKIVVIKVVAEAGQEFKRGIHTLAWQC